MAEAKKLNVLVICGSLRNGSLNRAVATHAAGAGAART